MQIYSLGHKNSFMRYNLNCSRGLSAVLNNNDMLQVSMMNRID